MTNSSIRKLLILGALLVSAIIFIQGYWTYRNWQLKDIAFNQQVHIALRKVATKLAAYNETKLPKQNIIQRISSNYYAVNINDEIDANILEDFLIREFEAQSLNTDFEYAVYDCTSDEMVYGNYCDIGERTTENTNEGVLPKFSNLEYYFVVTFPSKESVILRSMGQSILFTSITLLALGFFIYSSFIILRQKRLSEMQKDFINNMTHEFKTPISSMKIAADVLANSPNIQSNERLKKYVEIIKNQNIRLNSQVEKVLDIARIEKDALKLNFEKVNLTEIVTEIIESFKLKISPTDGKIELIKPDVQIFVEADKLHLGNVIYNILDNSIKYYKDTPIITVILDEKTPSLSIEDNGIGIPNEHLYNLFNKFFRVPTGNIHNVKGFGLGLYYVKNICDAHKWKIDVQSKENVGTTFTIKFEK
ncbi:sensor histidine kinase [Portibacter lacus]|uniref:histidine kinase n=1 Tax=Portibacter lacus TaxID=1099794 RepID=A0AA37SQQ9_9BACT|nr:HAMP domain-containing sensor histidine kinase [Portibacter lacus]GLR18040.1 two-component sensor histidine kinase [Portibacter lacus]